jgi:hypothetical protein
VLRRPRFPCHRLGARLRDVRRGPVTFLPHALPVAGLHTNPVGWVQVKTTFRNRWGAKISPFTASGHRSGTGPEIQAITRAKSSNTPWLTHWQIRLKQPISAATIWKSAGCLWWAAERGRMSKLLEGGVAGLMNPSYAGRRQACAVQPLISRCALNTWHLEQRPQCCQFPPAAPLEQMASDTFVGSSTAAVDVVERRKAHLQPFVCPLGRGHKERPHE